MEIGPHQSAACFVRGLERKVVIVPVNININKAQYIANCYCL